MFSVTNLFCMNLKILTEKLSLPWSFVFRFPFREILVKRSLHFMMNLFHQIQEFQWFKNVDFYIKINTHTKWKITLQKAIRYMTWNSEALKREKLSWKCCSLGSKKRNFSNRITVITLISAWKRDKTTEKLSFCMTTLIYTFQRSSKFLKHGRCCSSMQLTSLWNFHVFQSMPYEISTQNLTNNSKGE